MPLTQLEDNGAPFPNGDPDVQRTSFSLDVLGRFVCNTFEEATTNPDFDVVVIGSGMYGGYCAAKIFRESAVPGRTPLRILVLEAGPFLVHEHGQNIGDLGLSNPFRPVTDTFSEDAQRTRDLVWGIGWRGNTGFPGTAYCVGGKSLYWGGWCPRLRAEDLGQWPRELADYLTSPSRFGANLPNRFPAPANTDVYGLVEFEIGVRPADDFVFDPIEGPNDPPGSIGLNEALGARLTAALTDLRAAGPTFLPAAPEPPPIAVQTQSFVSGVFSPDKFSSLTLLTSALRSARGTPDAQSRLFLVPNAHVSKLVVPDTEKDGATTRAPCASGVEVFVNGTRRLLPIKPACTVVLAMGCLESTRLALECFPTEPGNRDKERMGRNLMAHLRFDFSFQVDRRAFAEWVLANTGRTLRDQLQTASFHVQGNTPNGRFHFQVYGTGDNSNNPEGLLYRMIPDADLARRLAAMQNPNAINLIFRACGEMVANRADRVGAPGTSWVDLAGSADRDQTFDHARAFVNYADQSDAPIWTDMRDAAIALSRAMGALGPAPAEDRHEVGSTWHDSGTLFIGEDPGSSVTDTLGHFHHIANVACVDQALFPTVGSANPVLTGLCLARRVAETIVDRAVSEPALSAEEAAAERAQGFEFLLDSTNAPLWKPNNLRLNANRPFLIENGTVLEVHGDAGLGALFYDDPRFENFELRLQWKAFRGNNGAFDANSGVFLRAPRPPLELTDANFYDQSLEVQIDDTGYDFARRRFGSPLHRTGAVYTRHPARRAAQKLPSAEGTDGFWNDYRITANGTRIAVTLNGHLVSEGAIPAAGPSQRYLGFQYHTGKIQFRHVRIHQL